MNASSRTLPLSGRHGVASPSREIGSSALDRRETWAPPDQSTMVLDHRGAPAARAVIGSVHARWPAPNPLLRIQFPAPDLFVESGRSNLIEPIHPIDVPDIAVARRDAEMWSPTQTTIPTGRPLPPPTLADAAAFVLATPPAAVASQRSGVRRRLTVGFVAAAGAACAAVAAAVTLL